MKKIADFFVFISIVYVIFVTIDCFRLKEADDLKRPFIVIKSSETPDVMTFTGLGYKMVYKVEKKIPANGVEIVYAKEGAFILFDSFTLWTNYYNYGIN